MGVISRAPVTCISDLTFRIRNILLGLPGTVTKFRRFSMDIILLSNPHSPVSLASFPGFPVFKFLVEAAIRDYE